MKGKNLYWGLFFIFAAVLIILKQFDILLGVNMFNLIITLLLLPVIFKSIKHIYFGGILFPLAIIALLYADQLKIQKITPWPILGIALFLSIGLSFIFPYGQRQKHKQKKNVNEVKIPQNEQKQTNETYNDSEVNVFVKFGGTSKYIKSQNLNKVNVYCQFGGAKVFLDKAIINGEEAIIYVAANCSVVELYIPKTWEVENQVISTIGSVNEEGMRILDYEKRKIILQGKISFGEIKIIYI